jgi:hypothetical protein
MNVRESAISTDSDSESYDLRMDYGTIDSS